MDAEFDWLTLDPDEEVQWSDTPHPYSLVPAIVVGLLLAVVLVGVVILVGAYLSHRNTHYVVTSDALYKKTGVLSRNVQRIEFDKVQDTSYRQSFLGAKFGYGTVDVSTAGGGGVELSFANVAEPQAVQTLVNERLRTIRDRRDDGERDVDDVLAEILSELRAIRSAVGDASPDRSASGANSNDSVPSVVEDPTGRLDGDTGRLDGNPEVSEDPADESSSGSDVGETAPGPATGETPPERRGPPPEEDENSTGPEAFEFEDGQ